MISVLADDPSKRDGIDPLTIFIPLNEVAEPLGEVLDFHFADVGSEYPSDVQHEVDVDINSDSHGDYSTIR